MSNVRREGLPGGDIDKPVPGQRRSDPRVALRPDEPGLGVGSGIRRGNDHGGWTAGARPGPEVGGPGHPRCDGAVHGVLTVRAGAEDGYVLAPREAPEESAVAAADPALAAGRSEPDRSIAGQGAGEGEPPQRAG